MSVHVRSDGWFRDYSIAGDVLHMQQAAHLRFPEAGCVLMHHWRHLPPIVRLRVAMCRVPQTHLA